MHRRFALVAAVIGWAAILLQMRLTVHNSLVAGHGIGHGLVIFFGFFTVTTNIFIALVLTARAVESNAPVWAFFRRPAVVTCATACMVIVGVTYFLLLRRLWNPQGLQYYVDVTLHYVMPILTAAFWWLAVPRGSIAWSGVGSMLVYPIAYMVYVFARGPLVGSYPYFFIDVNTLGLQRALVNAAGMTAFFLLVLVLLIVVNNQRRAVRPN
jgi:hypothetical protein